MGATSSRILSSWGLQTDPLRESGLEMGVGARGSGSPGVGAGRSPGGAALTLPRIFPDPPKTISPRPRLGPRVSPAPPGLPGRVPLASCMGPLCRDRAYPEGTRGQPHLTSCWRPSRLCREARVQVERGGTCPSALPRSPPTLTLTSCSPLGLSLPPVCIALLKLPELPAPRLVEASPGPLPTLRSYSLSPNATSQLRPLPLLPRPCQGVSWKTRKAVEVWQPAPYPPWHSPVNPGQACDPGHQVPSREGVAGKQVHKAQVRRDGVSSLTPHP